MAQKSQKCPSGLGATGRRLWRRITGEYELSVVELETLEAACRQADAVAECEEVVAREGTSVPGSKGQMRLHPGIAEARLGRAAVAALLARIDLPVEEDPEQPVESAASRRARQAAEARWRRERAKGQRRGAAS